MEDLGAQLASLDDDMLGLLQQFMRTCTGNARQEWERLCAANGIHFDESGSATGTEGQTVDVPTPDFVEALEREAFDFDRLKLGRSTLVVWREKFDEIKAMEREADAHWERRSVVRCLHRLRMVRMERLIKWEEKELERRQREFRTWTDAVTVAVYLRRWVIRHREMSLEALQKRQAAAQTMQKWRERTLELKHKERQAEDARDFYATTNAFTIWRRRAADLKAQRHFKHFFLMTKYGRLLIKTFRSRKKARTEAELTRRYQQFVRSKDEAIKQKSLEQWHAKTMQIREDDITASEHHQHALDQKAKTVAHDALTRMYEQTVDTRENCSLADIHFSTQLISRLAILSPNGQWRVQSHTHILNAQRADEYRGIKMEEKAQSALRNMRNTATRTRQMVAMAEEWREKQERRKAVGFLGVWRRKVAEKRAGEGGGGGEGGDWEMSFMLPQTPAARKSKLLG